MRIIKKVLRFCKKRVKKFFLFFPSSKAYYSLIKLQNERVESAIFITSYALGDLVYAIAYLKAWRNQNPSKRIVLIADPNKKDVIESYSDYDEVIYYDRNSKMGKNILIRLNGSRFYSFIGKRRGIYNTIPDQIYGRRSGRDNLDLMRKYLQLPAESKITYPHPQKVQITSISNFEANRKNIAVLNAYSGGKIICYCTELLNNIVHVLKKRGYLVFSNIIGEQEPLSGTYPLKCGLLELYSIVDEIPLMISVRSGIMDWLISTGSKKFVIYGSNVSVGFCKLFNLSAWKRCNCKEVYASMMSNEEIVSAFEEYISR